MADDSEQVGQDEIEQLLRQAQEAGGVEEAPAAKEETPAESGDVAVDQAEIESLLSGAASAAQAPAAQTPAAQAPVAAPPVATAPTSTGPPSPVGAAASSAEVSQDDIELLLNKAEEAIASVEQESVQPVAAMPAGVQSFEFQKFSGTAANTDAATLELMRDVQLDMTIELGRTHMHLEDVLRLKQGTVVPLNKLAGDPADIYVNGRLVARGEVLVLNDNFCVRVAELIVGDSACA